MDTSKTSIGVMFRREQDPAALADAARKAEALGFDQFWIVEDCFYMGGISQAAIALTATSSIKVGIGINPGVAHNAAILAMEYSTVERAFPGRLIGGIGHGVDVWMKQIGESVASPLTAIEETTTAVRRLLNGERITTDGRYVKLTDVELDPPPATAPPILLGVRARKSIQLAGRICDGVLLAESSGTDYIRWARDVMGEGRTEPGHIGVYVHAWIDDNDPHGAFNIMRRVVAGAVGNEIAVNTEHLSYVDELRKLIDKGGPDALHDEMPDEWVRDLGISGSTDDARATIGALVDAGANSIILTPMPEWDWFAWLDSVGTLAG